MSITGSEQWMYNAGGGFYPTTIDNSLRFENTATSNLNRNHTANRKTFTMSFWMKRDELSRNMAVIETRVSSQSLGNYAGVRIETDNALSLFDYSGGYVFRLKYSAALRDVSAWYHVVLRFDTTQSVATNRIRLYINGEQKTFDTHTSQPAQNASIQFGNGDVHRIGKYSDSTSLNYSGYMADWYIIDGQSLGPTSFGELKSGIWIPKEYSGSYGTGGFHLEFDGNANDSSGNSNNWTANGVSSYDYMPDSPTNNFNTLNSNAKSAGLTLSEGNLKTNNSNDFALGTIPVSSGKWYFEHYVNSSNGGFIGIWETEGVFSTAVDDSGNNTDGYGYYENGNKVRNGSYQSYGSSFTTGDIVGCAFDLDNGKVYFSKNGTFQNSGNPAAGTNAAYTGLTGALVTKTGHFNTNSPTVANFGQDSTFAGYTSAGGNADDNGLGDFKYAPPSGFLAMCSQNLPELAIDPANDETSADHFGTALWTGNGGASQTISGLGFQGDFTWHKQRNGAQNHLLFDTVRGIDKYLKSDTDEPEATNATFLTSFNSDGFVVGNNTVNNGSGETNVGWTWKAGGTAVSNTDGSITSSVSANPKAGFSIVTYSGNGTSGATVGHGLGGVAPDMIIHKARNDGGDNWTTYHSGIASDAETDGIFLNLTNPAQDNSVFFNDTAPTSSVFSLGNNHSVNGSSADYVAYCFANVEGHQKAGTFTGRGSGTFVNLGFRPAWLMVKNVNIDSHHWVIYDSTRDPDNVMGKYLYANTSASEVDSARVDFVSNGFVSRVDSWDIAQNGVKYIYLAIAEQPFKYSNAR
jgi:hypothetical protein